MFFHKLLVYETDKDMDGKTKDKPHIRFTSQLENYPELLNILA